MHMSIPRACLLARLLEYLMIYVAMKARGISPARQTQKILEKFTYKSLSCVLSAYLSAASSKIHS